MADTTRNPLLGIKHFAAAAQGYVVHSGESFFVRHACVTGAGESCETLQRRVTSWRSRVESTMEVQLCVP